MNECPLLETLETLDLFPSNATDLTEGISHHNPTGESFNITHYTKLVRQVSKHLINFTCSLSVTGGTVFISLNMEVGETLKINPLDHSLEYLGLLERITKDTDCESNGEGHPLVFSWDMWQEVQEWERKHVSETNPLGDNLMEGLAVEHIIRSLY